MRREVHSRELQLMDAVRRKYMENQSKVKEVELKRMDDEIQRKVRVLNFVYTLAIFLDRATFIKEWAEALKKIEIKLN